MLSGHELDFIIGMGFSVIAGFIIGVEREARHKPAGISTNALVIGGAFIFTFLSTVFDPELRIPAQIVSGIGFLGAGIILRDRVGNILNLTTAASIWFSAAIGMAIGFKLYYIAMIAVLFSILIPKVPHISHKQRLK